MKIMCIYIIMFNVLHAANIGLEMNKGIKESIGLKSDCLESRKIFDSNIML